MVVVGAGAEFTVRSGPEHARRRQVPLGLGYALSIHRCQGMTLDRVELDLRSAFECGQGYVALSRCRSLQHIRVLGFDPAKVKAHPAALRFVQGLANSAPRGAEPVAG